MDKNIWLKVIKQELGLLDQLASGMIEDSNLSKEEVELALSRSKVVVREFEMLMQQISPYKPETRRIAEPSKEGKSPEPVQPESSEIFVPEIEVNTKQETVIGQGKAAMPVPEVPKAEAEPFVASPVLQQVIPPVVQPTPVPEAREESNILFDDQKEAVSQFKTSPLKSLKEGLSLNDRYLFQRELFDNDKSRLDDTVAALDRLSNIKDAVDYMKSNFKWTKNEASEKFVQLVKRRFS